MSANCPQPADGKPKPNRMIRVLIASIRRTRVPLLAELVKSGLYIDVRERGILSPPVVRETPDGPTPYEAVIGNGRITCWLELDHADIDVINLGPLSAGDAVKAIARDHTLRRNMDSPELTGYAVQYMRATGCTPAEAMAALGIAGSVRTKVGVVLNSPPECLKAVLDGDVPASTAYLFLSKVRNPVDQVAMANRVRAEKLTREEVAALFRRKGGRTSAKPPVITIPFTGYDQAERELLARAEDVRKARRNGVSEEVYALTLKRKKGGAA